MMEEWIKEAKNAVERHYNKGPDPKRIWLRSSPPDSYGDPGNQVVIFVWSGSPPKGYVLASFGAQFVVAFGYSGRKIGAWSENKIWQTYTAKGK